MATTRTTETTTEAPRIVRDASGREMSALSYTAVYRQKLKEEQLRRISKSKLLKDAAADEAKAKEKEARRAAMEEQLRNEREALARRNAKADAVLRVVSAQKVQENDAQTDSQKQAQAQNMMAASAPQTPPPADPIQQTASEQASEPTAAPQESAAKPAETPAPEAQAPAKVQSIPSPVLRPAPTASAVPTQKKPAYVPYTAPRRSFYTSAASGVVKIDGTQMRMEADPFDDTCFVAVPEATDADVIILSDDMEGDTLSLSTQQTAEELFDQAAQTDDASQAEQTTEPAGEPKQRSAEKDTEDLADALPSDDTQNSHTARPAGRRARREVRRAKSNRQRAEDRLADEAIRAALAEEAKRAAIQSARDQSLARIAKDTQEEKNALAAMKADAASEVLAQKEKEEKIIAEQQAEYRKERKERGERIRKVQEKHQADTAAEEEKKTAREKKAADDEAQKYLRLAAQRAERASERDRAAAERARYEALCDPNIKDWRQDVHITAAAAPKASDMAQATPTNMPDGADDQPLRVSARRSSYSRSELKALRLAQDDKIRHDIAAEVALWNEIEIEEDAYAVLPEGIEDMTRRQKRALLKQELRGFKAQDRACARTIRQLKKVRPSWMTVKAGYEALVSEKALIEALARAVKLCRLAKRKKYIRPLCANIANEIKREAKLLRMMKDMTGFAPQATDPMMPKGLKKQTPFKTPTKLYRTE